jgi:hypothetical protein
VRRAIVNVPYSFIDAVLPNVFTGERIVVASGTCEWDCIVHEINILLRPLSEISHKPVQIVSLRHADRAIFVEF